MEVALVLEAIQPRVGGAIRDNFTIPVYWIRAGSRMDGQSMIVSDILGIAKAFTPKFVKKYADLSTETARTFGTYDREVRENRFPTLDHTYSIPREELAKLPEGLDKRE
jgi:3-methyl-2-oxobutanoate hydroxymethyltransferase